MRSAPRFFYACSMLKLYCRGADVSNVAAGSLRVPPTGETIQDSAGENVLATGSVQSGNQAPVADAGPDPEATAGQQVLLSGAASYDPDGKIVLYEWDLDADGVYEVDGNRITWSFESPGQYLAVLRVADNDGATGADDCVITVASSEGTE